jgi:acid phosphatase type 7
MARLVMKPDRLLFLRQLLGLTALLATASVALGQPASADSTNAPLAITHGPFLQAPTETGITVSWATSLKCVSRVEYRAASSERWLTNLPAHHGLVDADTTVHNVPLTGLEPGTRYRYRVVSQAIADFQAYQVKFGDTVASPEYEFATLDPRQPATAFVVVNDRHEKVAPLSNSLASVSWTNVNLVFLNGDMVNWAQSEAQLYRCVVDPCVQSFATRLPLVYTRGNHDTRGSFARHLPDYFPTASGRYYYTFREGPVAFLVLDSGEDKPDTNAAYSGLVAFEPYLRQELEWLARQIHEPAFRKAPFRICLMHIPPAQVPEGRGNHRSWLQDNVVPLLNRGKVDLLICAHTHRYALQPAGERGLDCPMIIGGTETVIRGDVTKEQIRVTVTDLSNKPLPQLLPIRAAR